MRGALAVAAVLLAACTSSASPSTEPSTPPSSPPTTSSTASTTSTTIVGGGDAPLVDPVSHTADRLDSIEDYEALARAGIGDQSVVKFSITEFADDPELVWLDSNFYSLHDEWYWFQLLNGTPVRGYDTSPPDTLAGDPGPFESIADAYVWAEANAASLPLDLRFTSLGRLYSPLFYEIALDAAADRRIGLGSLIRASDRDTGVDRWLIELEFSDEVDTDQVDTYFDVIGAALPDDIADALEWVPRSRAQELTADQLEASGGPNADRVARYEELSTPGDVEVYSPAIAAGRLLVVTEGGRWSLSDAGPNDIVAIDRAPDDLPAGNGLITGTPQTPLAHVNILALNRGIPNAFLAGLADDPVITQLGRVRAPVLVQTTAAGELEVIPLTNEEYTGWIETLGKAPIGVERVDPAAIPLVERIQDLDVRLSTAAELDAIRPIIGGKAAGFLELAAPGTTTMPPDAMVLTVKAYLEHMTQFGPTVDALLANTDLDSVRGRYLFLEGRDDFDERYTTDADQEFADDFEAGHSPGTPIGDALAADGFVRLIRSSTIDSATLAAITAELDASFGSYAPTQGLRFRSSSTVEDIEGFNGAGLYDSNTGYLDPTVLADEDDHKRTVERAILRTWSSYWSATAFEERQRENVDHRSGAMAVLVHARFDDDLETNNGVATFTLAPDSETTAVMLVNVQDGAVSVTNAENESGLLPEVIEVRVAEPGSAPVVTRLATSSITDPDPVMSDAELIELFDQVDAVARSWLQRANAELDDTARSSTLTLDLEFRTMASGWPAVVDGAALPARIVVKQARTLDPGLRGVPPELIALPVPRDVLAHTVRAVALTCTSDVGPFVGVQLFTDPLSAIDLGFADTPLERWSDGLDVAELARSNSVRDDASGRETTSCESSELLTTSTQYLLDLLASR